MIKVVLDTNVFVSGIFWPGNYCSQIINLWRDEEIQLISSIPIVDELVETLINFKIQLGFEKIRGWEQEVLRRSELLIPQRRINMIKDDPDDNKFLEAAVEGNADYIISQDRHLLRLKEFEGIRIVKPEQFLSKFRRYNDISSQKKI